jgi:hypothetical protein
MIRLRLSGLLLIGALLSVAFCGAHSAVAEDYTIHRFERIQLTDVYYSEGANFGDINGDGKTDVVYGPHWYAGPDYKNKQGSMTSTATAATTCSS